MAPQHDAGRLRPQALALWLQIVAALVVLIVVVGGVTRLTESGLSITRWDPIAGAIPPLTREAWEHAFELYRQSPQFRYQSGPAGMDLAAFRTIFFWEWFHRLIGRVIGLAFALPLAWFWLRGAIPPGFKLRLVVLLVLGGLQGVFGWLMVSSGLEGTMTSVSHFWLSIHLMTAFLTLAGLIWTALDLRNLASEGTAIPARLRPVAVAVGLVLAVQLLLGAWVAGLDAGHASDSWPLMQGRFVPEYDRSHGLGWALTHDPFLVHFLHRWWAWVAVAALVMLARKVRARDRRASVALHAGYGTQILLGIATVTSGMVIWLAAAHQFVGALLVIAATWAAHVAGRGTPGPR